MPKRPDQHQLDQNEAGATDYKTRRQTEDRNRPDGVRKLEADRTTKETPNERMESRRKQSEEDRQTELEEARRNIEAPTER